MINIPKWLNQQQFHVSNKLVRVISAPCSGLLTVVKFTLTQNS